MHTERINAVILLFASLLMGCSVDSMWCPELSDDIKGLLPVKYEKRQVRYMAGNDTISIDFGKVVRSKPIYYKHATFCMCEEPNARMQGYSSNGQGMEVKIHSYRDVPTQQKVYKDKENINNIFRVRRITEAGDTISVATEVTIDFNQQHIQQWCIEKFPENDFSELDSWHSQTGKEYKKVFRIAKHNGENNPSTVFYLSPGHGLVQLEWQDGTVWSLLE